MMKEQDMRRLATEAQVDIRTLKKLLGGGEIRKLVGERIRAAAKKLRLKVPA